jgi:starvation-inducible DNA-binding protein
MIIDTLKTSLANHFEAALTVHGYHWNVEGVDFKQYHSFFAEIYEDFYEQVDVLAEYVRTLTDSVEYVNASMDVLQKNKTIKGDFIVGNKAVEMCKSIIELNNALIDDYAAIFDEATKENQQGLANWAADRLDKVSRTNWMVVAITKE